MLAKPFPEIYLRIERVIKYIVCRTKVDKSLIELKQVRAFFPDRNSKLTRIIHSKFESPNPKLKFFYLLLNQIAV
jgi:hypothetical protein